MTNSRLIEALVLKSKDDTPAKKFVKDMYDRHYNNPINPREFVVPYKDDWSHHAMFDISAGHHPTEAHIHYFRTHPRKSGVGTKAIKELQGHAERHGVSLHLGVGGHETPHKVLTKFYKKHGFMGDKDDMVWHPKKDINESFRFLDKVHRNPPMETIKNIAKHSQHQHARISIDHDGTLWAAAAERFLHDQFGKEPHGNARNQHSYGFVFHKKDGHFVYGARKREDKGISKHPVFDKFHKAGINHLNDNYEINEDVLNEDAPTVNIGGGAIAGAGIGPQGEPGRNNKLGLMRRKLDVINKVKKAKLETT